jgi:hypothetical protein
VPDAHLVLGPPHGQRQQLYHLMPPDTAPTATGGVGKRLPAVPADLGDDHHDLMDLLDQQQRTVASTVARLAATLPSRGRRFRPRRGLPWIRRWGTRGSGRVLAQPGFQLADALLQRGILCAAGNVLLPERR